MIVRKINWPAAKNCQDEQKGLEKPHVLMDKYSHILLYASCQFYGICSATFTNTVCDLNIV